MAFLSDINHLKLEILGLYGLLFRRNKEAAFSNYRLWESAGFVIAYAYSTTLCARMKLYVLLGNLILGVIGYIVVEVRHRRKVNWNFEWIYLPNTNAFHFSSIQSNRNVDLRSRRPKMQHNVKLKLPNRQRLRKPTMRRTTWRRISKSHISSAASIFANVLKLIE